LLLVVALGWWCGFVGRTEFLDECLLDVLASIALIAKLAS